MTVSENSSRESHKGTMIRSQKARMVRSLKPMSHNTLPTVPRGSQQTMRNLTAIDRARKNRNGQKRSTRELVESVSSLMRDGKERSVSEIAKCTRMGWATAYWLLDLIEMIQREPFLAREGGMKRKRYYRMVSPRKR